MAVTNWADYKAAEDISLAPTFGAMLIALVRKADGSNLAKIRRAWPGVIEEVAKRYDMPGGCCDKAEFIRVHGAAYADELWANVEKRERAERLAREVAV